MLFAEKVLRVAVVEAEVEEVRDPAEEACVDSCRALSADRDGRRAVGKGIPLEQPLTELLGEVEREEQCDKPLFLLEWGRELLPARRSKRHPCDDVGHGDWTREKSMAGLQ